MDIHKNCLISGDFWSHLWSWGYSFHLHSSSVFLSLPQFGHGCVQSYRDTGLWQKKKKTWLPVARGRGYNIIKIFTCRSVKDQAGIIPIHFGPDNLFTVGVLFHNFMCFMARHQTLRSHPHYAPSVITTVWTTFKSHMPSEYIYTFIYFLSVRWNKFVWMWHE